MLLPVLLVSLWAEAGEVRHHGFKMNPRYRLVIEEDNGLVKVGLLERTRDVGGKSFRRPGEAESTDEEALLFRNAKKENLIQLRAEALQASAPNPLKNPAQRYRIIVEGVELEPGYGVTVEANAADARDTFFAEIQKIEARARGIYREALHYGAALALGIFSEAGRMPAALSETVKATEAAKTRGITENLQRKNLAVGRKLEPEATGKTPLGTPASLPASKNVPKGQGQ